MTGDEQLHFFWFLCNYIKQYIGESNLSGLSLGCTEGNPTIEMRLVESGMFNNIKVMDVALGLLEKQKAVAVGRNLHHIEYIRQDLNKVNLEENVYNFIWAIGTIHHVENLEFLFDQVNQALAEKGLFAMREYIGPNRMQFTNEQLSLVNEILSILPEKYRKSHYGSLKRTMQKIAEEDLIRMDPSESIRSQEIMGIIQQKLEIIKVSYTGGTILHPLLDSIASNFEGDEDRNAVLKLLILFEKTLIDKGIFPSDYVFCMAKKKKTVSA
jgi:SAM-dependent methyltransferase